MGSQKEGIPRITLEFFLNGLPKRKEFLIDMSSLSVLLSQALTQTTISGTCISMKRLLSPRIAQKTKGKNRDYFYSCKGNSKFRINNVAGGKI